MLLEFIFNLACPFVYGCISHYVIYALGLWVYSTANPRNIMEGVWQWKVCRKLVCGGRC